MEGARARSARRGATGPALALAATLLAGCSGGEEPPPDDAPPAPTDEATPSPEAPEQPESGPLEVYLGYDSAVRTAEEWVVHIARRENDIAACMAEQGFEYDPQVPGIDDIEYVEGPAQGSREFVEQWGYGVWDSPPNGGGGGFMYSGGADPNWERRQLMSEAEGEAYDTALSGPITEVYEDGSISREGGCYDVAQGWAVGDDAYLTGVRDEAQAFLDAIGADSRFGDVDAAWASCMADGGFTYGSPADAEQQFLDEMLGEIEDGILDQDAVAEHAPEEVRVAVADLDCQEATDWAARHRAIEIELQQEYVDAHLADLEALADALVTAPTTEGG